MSLAVRTRFTGIKMAMTSELREHVLSGVAEAFRDFGYQMNASDIVGKDRQRATIKARRIACYILRNSYHHETTSIGAALNIDHSTVVHHCKVAEGELPIYFDIAELYRRAVEIIGCRIPTWITLRDTPNEVKNVPKIVEPEPDPNDWVQPMDWTQKKKSDLAAWRKYQAL